MLAVITVIADRYKDKYIFSLISTTAAFQGTFLLSRRFLFT